MPPSGDGDSDSTEASNKEDYAGDGGSRNTRPRATGWQAYMDNFPDFALLFFTVRNLGSQASASNLNCELDYFQLFFTDQLIEEIERGTNRYTCEKISSAGIVPKCSIWKDWEVVFRRIQSLPRGNHQHGLESQA